MCMEREEGEKPQCNITGTEWVADWLKTPDQSFSVLIAHWNHLGSCKNTTWVLLLEDSCPRLTLLVVPLGSSSFCLCRRMEEGNFKKCFCILWMESLLVKVYIALYDRSWPEGRLNQTPVSPHVPLNYPGRLGRLSNRFLLLALFILASGTTWIQEIVDMIEQNGDVAKCQRAIIQHRHPFIEWARPPQPSGKGSSLTAPSPFFLFSDLIF